MYNFSLDSLYVALLIFGRVGAALSMLPVFGENFVNKRLRVLFGFTFSLLLTPVLQTYITAPQSPFEFLHMLILEVLVGLFFAVLIRLFTYALEIGGSIISFQMGLSAATAFNPAMSQQGSIISGFFLVMALALIFALNIHHLFLASLFKSYTLFPPGDLPEMRDVAESGVDVVAKSFALGVQLAGPFIVINLIYQFSVGLLNRLMPQLQIFFVSLPAQILLGILMLMMTLSAMMMWYFDAFKDMIVLLFDRP